MYNEESSKSTLQCCVEEKPKEGPEDKARQWVQLLAAPVALAGVMLNPISLGLSTLGLGLCICWATVGTVFLDA